MGGVKLKTNVVVLTLRGRLASYAISPHRLLVLLGKAGGKEQETPYWA